MDPFVQRLRAALARPLPGLEAQLQMAPAPRLGWNPQAGPDGLRNAAALVLLYPVDGAWHLPLTLRAAGLRHHKGQVSLPGGRADAGESMEDAALREACEEIGVPGESVTIVGRLTPLPISVSAHILHPIVGTAPERPAFRRSEREVARILEVPLSALSAADRVGHRTWMDERHGEPVAVDVPYFSVDGEEVWGATAMVLSELRQVVAGLLVA